MRDLGCDILQGYALARPMPADAIPDFVQRQEWRAPGAAPRATSRARSAAPSFARNEKSRPAVPDGFSNA
jgi:predicted signal transduction protein with EAL and GGDEF domain